MLRNPPISPILAQNRSSQRRPKASPFCNRPYHFFLFALLVTNYSWTTTSAMTQSASQAELIEALMVESLRNNLVQACENERITLHCPRNTHILLQNVFYGRLVPSNELCPVGATTAQRHPSEFLAERHSQPSSSSQKQRPPHFKDEDTSCDFAEAHQRIAEICRSKRKCRITVRPEFFGERDACPDTSKYLQISYKCKPISFEDQNFCEGTSTQLSCKSNKRLSIYSAQYGRTVNGQAMHCALKEPVNEDCVSDVHPLILKGCHAQSGCTIAVNDQFLGNPCPEGVPKYLSLIYMCVNDEVFSEAAIKGTLESMQELEKVISFQHLNTSSTSLPGRHSQRHRHQNHAGYDLHRDRQSISSENTEDEMPQKYNDRNSEELSPDYGIDDHGHDEDSAAGRRREQRRHPSAENSGNVNNNVKTAGSVGVGKELEQFIHFFGDNKERALLYTFLSASTCLIMLLLACICWQCRARARDKRRASALVTHFSRHQTVSMPPTKSAESGSLIGTGTSNNTSPVYLDSDDSHRLADAYAVGGSDALFGGPDLYGPAAHHGHGHLFGGIGGTGTASSINGGSSNSGHYIRFPQAPTPPRLHYYS